MKVNCPHCHAVLIIVNGVMGDVMCCSKCDEVFILSREVLDKQYVNSQIDRRYINNISLGLIFGVFAILIGYILKKDSQEKMIINHAVALHYLLLFWWLPGCVG